MENQIYGTPSAGSQMKYHKNADVINSGGGRVGLVINSACLKKNNANSPRPTTPRRVTPARRLPLSHTVRASQRNATRLKIDSASAIDCSRCLGSKNVESSIH